MLTQIGLWCAWGQWHVCHKIQAVSWSPFKNFFPNCLKFPQSRVEWTSASGVDAKIYISQLYGICEGICKQRFTKWPTLYAEIIFFTSVCHTAIRKFIRTSKQCMLEYVHCMTQYKITKCIFDTFKHNISSFFFITYTHTRLSLFRN